jgi:hypothetical protein
MLIDVSNITEKAITYGSDQFRRDVLSSLIRSIDPYTREYQRGEALGDVCV